MELVKSKGMVIFLVVFLSITIISSINTKKYDDKVKAMNKSYIALNHDWHPLFKNVFIIFLILNK